MAPGLRVVAGVHEKVPVLAILSARDPIGIMFVDGPVKSMMVTVPGVVGVQVMEYGVPAGTAS